MGSTFSFNRQLNDSEEMDYLAIFFNSITSSLNLSNLGSISLYIGEIALGGLYLFSNSIEYIPKEYIPFCGLILFILTVIGSFYSLVTKKRESSKASFEAQIKQQELIEMKLKNQILMKEIDGEELTAEEIKSVTGIEPIIETKNKKG